MSNFPSKSVTDLLQPANISRPEPAETTP